MGVLLKNNAITRLASSLATGATSLSVTTGQGSLFPLPTGSDWFPITIIKDSGALEIVRCTARSGDVFTVTRAQEGTAAQAFSAGDRVELRATAGVFDQQATDTASAKSAADAAQTSAAQAQTEVDALELITVKKDASTTTGAALLPAGTTAQQPVSPVDGMTRYNSDLKEMERYQNGKWLAYNVLDKALNEAVPVSIASASNINIGAAAANTITITGTTAIVGLGTAPSGARRTLLFTGALVLTHNAASLILPGNANITTAAGDTADFVSLGSGNWRCIGFTRFSGEPVTQSNARLCTAWVNFNGVGTVTIRDSYNVSSITRVGTGNYTVNFATAMARADYAVGFGFDADADGVTGFSTPAGTRSLYVPESLKTTSGFRATTGANSGPVFIDFRAINLQIFGGK